MFHWVPPLAYVPFCEDPWQNLQEFILPAIAISVFTLAIVMRMVRATMLEVLSLDYVRTARAKGVPRRTVLRKHALRNALIPVVTVVGFEVGALISGAAIAEIIFGLPGVGYQLLHAIFQRDYPIVQAATLIIAATFVVVELPRRHRLRPARPEDQRPMTPTTAGSWRLFPRGGGSRCPAKWRNPIGIVGAGDRRASSILIAIFGRCIWTIDPNNPVYDRLLGPSWAHPFGTDDLGRDTLARIIHGARVSFQVGATAVAISLGCGARDRRRLRLLQRSRRPRADARRRHPLRVPAADPGDPDRRACSGRRGRTR